MSIPFGTTSGRIRASPICCAGSTSRHDCEGRRLMISVGSRLGPYEILAPLGAGGMGEVWKARDPRLGREVAIKVLPSSFSQDPDRLRRFEQEARSASALDLPRFGGQVTA